MVSLMVIKIHPFPGRALVFGCPADITIPFYLNLYVFASTKRAGQLRDPIVGGLNADFF